MSMILMMLLILLIANGYCVMREQGCLVKCSPERVVTKALLELRYSCHGHPYVSLVEVVHSMDKDVRILLCSFL